MGTIGCPETLLEKYQSTVRKISEERRSDAPRFTCHHGEGLTVV
jgi:hypothetical protein